MTTTTRPARLNYTNAWSHLGGLTWDQLGLLLDRCDAGLEAGRSTALWLGRYSKVTNEIAARGCMGYKLGGERWMVGYPSMFESVA